MDKRIVGSNTVAADSVAANFGCCWALRLLLLCPADDDGADEALAEHLREQAEEVCLLFWHTRTSCSSSVPA